jgi:hypothetical protein
MNLEPDFVDLKALAGKPPPFKRIFAFLDVLFRRAAPVVELKHPFF